MSVGAVDEEEERDPMPAPTAEPVVEGPQLPDVIDRVTAEPMPANASNGQMGDEQWPPAVPSEAPGMVPAAPALNAGGPQQPQAPAQSPPVNVPGDTAQAYADQQGLGDADAAALQKLGAAKANAGGAEADALDTEADRKQDAADTQDLITQAANARTQQWADRAQAENEKYMKMDLHDYWADKSTGSKVLGGLAMIVGAVGRTDNSGNAGMKIVNDAIERDFRMQQARIEKQKGNAAAAKEQYQTGLDQKQQALSDAKLKEAAATDAAAAKLVALKVRQGIPIDQAQTDVDVVGMRQKANQLRLGTLREVHAMNLDDAKLQIEKQKEADDRLRAEAYARKMGRAGAGGSANNAAEAKILKAIEGGAQGSDVRLLAAQLGVKPQRVDALENQGRAAAAAAAKNVSGEDNPLAIRDGAGNVMGLAPNAKAVKSIQDRWVQYDNAIDALKQLQADRAKSSLPSPGVGDPLYDKAVLAVSAVTQANSSDKTTTHEAGTLKKYGLVNQGAITNVLADMQRRQEQFQNQLRPLPAAKPGPPPAGDDAGPAGNAAPPLAKAAPPASAQARAKAIVSDPSKRSLYNEMEWAKLIKKSRGN